MTGGFDVLVTKCRLRALAAGACLLLASLYGGARTDPDPAAGHTVTVDATADAREVVVTVADDYAFDRSAGGAEDPRRIGNVMVWVDGELVVQAFDAMGAPKYRGHGWDQKRPSNRREVVTVRVLRDLFPVDDGEHTVTVSVWQADDKPVGYFDRKVAVPPRPVPAIYPGKVIRCLFNLTADHLKADPALLRQCKEAGVNAVAIRVFNNPADSRAATVEQWRPSRAALVERLRWCKENGLLAWGTGDDFCRTADEYKWTSETPWAEQAVRETFRAAKEVPGVWAGVSMQDEIGGEVKPIYKKLKRWCDEEGGPPLSWPNRWKGPTDWEKPDVAHMAERYVSLGEAAWRHGRPLAATLWQYDQVYADARAGVPNGFPLMFQHGASGPFYTKRVEGGEYQSGKDELQQAGNSPEAVVMSAWIAMAYGASGIRTYGYDIDWKPERARQAVGTKDVQTGVAWGTPLGDALAHAYRSIAKHEAALLGAYRPPYRVDHWLVGRRAGLEFWINTRDRAEPCPAGPGGEVVTPAGPADYTGGPVPGGGVVIRTK
jgi:hypothetical protein